MLSGIPLFPVQASTVAPDVDRLYFLIIAVTSFFAIATVIAVAIFAIKYRDDSGEKVGAQIHGSIPLELGWSVIPFIISMGIFVYATVVFFEIVRPPAETHGDLLDRQTLDVALPARGRQERDQRAARAERTARPRHVHF